MQLPFAGARAPIRGPTKVGCSPATLCELASVPLGRHASFDRAYLQRSEGFPFLDRTHGSGCSKRLAVGPAACDFLFQFGRMVNPNIIMRALRPKSKLQNHRRASEVPQIAEWRPVPRAKVFPCGMALRRSAVCSGKKSHNYARRSRLACEPAASHADQRGMSVPIGATRHSVAPSNATNAKSYFQN